MESVKFDFLPETIQINSLSSESFRTEFHMERTKRVGKHSKRLDEYDGKIYLCKTNKLRKNLAIGENILVVFEHLKKKDALGKFYKWSVEHISYCNKETMFCNFNQK